MILEKTYLTIAKKDVNRKRNNKRVYVRAVKQYTDGYTTNDIFDDFASYDIAMREMPGLCKQAANFMPNFVGYIEPMS